MITLAKFLSLERSTRLRKLWRIMTEWEMCLRSDSVPPDNLQDFLTNLGRVLEDSASRCYEIELLPLASLLHRAVLESSASARLRSANDARHFLGSAIGKEAAEWDLLPPVVTASTVPTNNQIVPKSIKIVYCDDLRSPFNVGSVFRTAAAFGFSAVVLSPRCPDPLHPRLRRSAMGAIDLIPWRVMEFDSLPQSDVYRALADSMQVFSIELGGTILSDFIFPERGIAVIGSEELGVRPEILDICRRSQGIVSIPLSGAKASLNVGVSFGIVAAAWGT